MIESNITNNNSQSDDNVGQKQSDQHSSQESLHKKSNQASGESEVKSKTEFSSESRSSHEEQDQVVLPKITLEFSNPILNKLRDEANDKIKLAEVVATEWKNDGSFESLPIKQPIAQHFVGQGLKKAKEVEKKVSDKVTEAAIVVIPKVMSHIENIKSKFKK